MDQLKLRFSDSSPNEKFFVRSMVQPMTNSGLNDMPTGSPGHNSHEKQSWQAETVESDDDPIFLGIRPDNYDAPNIAKNPIVKNESCDDNIRTSRSGRPIKQPFKLNI